MNQPWTAPGGHSVQIRESEPYGRNSVPGGKIIYLIDDDVSVRRSLVRLLTLMNRQVRAFDSAEAFLAEVDRLPLGGIILDMQLSGMSGLELLRQMTNAGLRWPVIAMSGSQDEDAEAEALRLGAQLYLHKPFDAGTLLDTITQFL